MKKLIIFILSLFIFSIYTVDAANIRATWQVVADTTWAWYWWKLVFPTTWSWVFVNNDNYLLNPNSDLQISWSFWLSNQSTTTDPSLWWVTFDIWTVLGAPKVFLKNNLNNTFTFDWYAWSKWAGWIYFSPVLLKDSLNNNITNSKVVYDKSSGLIWWCAWSQNLWWICFDWLTLDTTPPDLTNILKPTAANSTKNFTLPESSSVEIENWDSSTRSSYSAWISFTHDMRKTKNYYIEVTDTSWNTSTWIIQVVANIPSKSLNSNNIWTWASVYSWTLWLDKIADWKDTHSIYIRLRDTYWNPVIPVTWVKNVEVTLWFNNNLDNDQITNANLWDAINFVNSDFLLVWWVIHTATSTNNNWNYNVSISSYAPSSSWSINPNNDINVNNLTINVTSLNWNTWVWEWNFDEKDNYSNAFKFTPAVSVTWLTNSNNWHINRDIETSFTWVIKINKTFGSSNLIDINVTHLLDVMSGSTYLNDKMSFQNLVWVSWTTTCRWYKTSTWYYYSNANTLCNKSSIPYSSNIIRDLWDKSSSQNINDSFKATPRLVTSSLTKFDTKYSSIISYDVVWKNVKYPSFTSVWWDSIVNNEIKIAWIVNKNNNNFSVVQDSSINYIWNIIKSDIYTLIHKNVAAFQKTWTWSIWTIYKKWDYTLTSWPAWIHTIIVDWWDIIIWDNINKIKWKVQTLIALKKTDWSKWNIWINNSVQFVWATLIADRSVISWNWTTFYSDTASAINQLFIKWSVISYNTIWWSSKSPVVCPFYINKTTCDLQTSKRYDFNHFRSYINWVQWSAVDWTTYWVNMFLTWYSSAPMIIEYDSDIQKYPPIILKIK